jgi:glycosyltransferase involved in cell wall biosynthesis
VPVVVGYGGPAELVTRESGFTVDLGAAAEIVARLRDLLGRLVEQPDEIERRSEPARRRVYEWFTWSAKARQVAQVYDWVLDRTPEKPDFGMPLGAQDGRAPRGAP